MLELTRKVYGTIWRS